mmetsp:Transcript_26016/g.60411  ORF Transcript_26016/g.60411 Transcript_26016/m.60411 type:complete len:220 (-) Transcript_26016:356-1015(-)
MSVKVVEPSQNLRRVPTHHLLLQNPKLCQNRRQRPPRAECHEDAKLVAAFKDRHAFIRNDVNVPQLTKGAHFLLQRLDCTSPRVEGRYLLDGHELSRVVVDGLEHTPKRPRTQHVKGPMPLDLGVIVLLGSHVEALSLHDGSKIDHLLLRVVAIRQVVPRVRLLAAALAHARLPHIVLVQDLVAAVRGFIAGDALFPPIRPQQAPPWRKHRAVRERVGA